MGRGISRRAPFKGYPRPTRAFPASPRAPRAKNIRSTFATIAIVRAQEVGEPVEPEMSPLERTTAKRRFPLAAATPAAPDRVRDPAPGTREMRDLFFVRPDVVNFNASYGTPVREVRTATLAKAASRVFHLFRGLPRNTRTQITRRAAPPAVISPAPPSRARNHRTSRPSPPDRRALALTARLES